MAHCDISRRQFLRTTLVGGAAALTLAGGVPGLKSVPRAEAGLFFDPHERETIEAATARIFPTDKDPGAKEAGAINYIDQQLAVYYRDAQQLYRDGVKRLDAKSQELFGADFVGLSPDQQDSVLEDAERNDSAFFGALRAHTMQGCFADPEYGGNKGYVMWKVIGFPGIKQPIGYPGDQISCKVD